MSKSREAQIKRLNRLFDELDNLPADVVDKLANGDSVHIMYDNVELLQRLAKEVRYQRLHKKLYGY